VGTWLACLAIGAFLTGRVFAFDWARLMTLPDMLLRAPRLSEPNPFKPQRERRVQRPEPLDTFDDLPARKPPEIADTRQPPRPAKPGKQQKDLFDSYQLPSLDLLADPPKDTAAQARQASLERNARCSRTCSTTSTSRARSPRSAPARW
jgi:S-DNA-T family DNA segregation ATPase FtsK/SpoIIIE